MKTFTLLRHAKSSWPDASLNDFERPLNKRGKGDAPFIANKLVEKQFFPQLTFGKPSQES